MTENEYGLTAEDVELLRDALTTLKEKQGGDTLNMMLLATMMSNSKGELEQRLDILKEERRDGKPKEELLHERIVLLEAKLIHLKDRLISEEVLDSIS